MDDCDWIFWLQMRWSDETLTSETQSTRDKSEFYRYPALA
jgi:hypothetical protein